MINDKLKMIGSMEAVLLRGNGDVEVTRKDNIIVDAGFDLICDALGNSAARPAVLSHIAVGTDATAAAAGNAALGAEIARVAAAYAHTAGTKVFTIQATFAPGTGTGAITESGVLNAAAAGTLLDRVTFAVINKGAADTLQVTFTFTLS